MILNSAYAFIIFILMFPDGRTSVPAPFDVKVSCHNFDTTVFWNYTKGPSRPLFRVQILKDLNIADSVATNTRLHHLNISSSVTDFHNSYYVNVSAINGSQISTSAESQQFSYHKYLPAELRCTLDFPKVTLTVKHGQIKYTFSHPYQVYKETPTVKNLMSLCAIGCKECWVFQYRVVYNGTNLIHHDEECMEEICRGTFHVPGNSDLYCITLSGKELNTNSGIICQREESENGTVHAVVISACVLVIGCFVLIGVVATLRTIRMQSMPSLPKPLVHHGFKTHIENTMKPKDFNGQIAGPLVSSTPLLLSSKDEESVDSPSLATPQEGSRFPIGWVCQQQWSSSEEAMHLIDHREACDIVCGGQSRQWEPTRKEPVVDRSGSSVHSIFSGYDRPQVLEVEISPGDIVEGYGS
ncbi:hypothetical protein GJAV_G00151390 [Gymnothorax javanicus]|nr:hypothetical protein GJAV_G00151390 [Gymnothorax javanicus]